MLHYCRFNRDVSKNICINGVVDDWNRLSIHEINVCTVNTFEKVSSSWTRSRGGVGIKEAAPCKPAGCLMTPVLMLLGAISHYIILLFFHVSDAT